MIKLHLRSVSKLAVHDLRCLLVRNVFQLFIGKIIVIIYIILLNAHF